MSAIYNYLSPLILPVLPSAAGSTRFTLNMVNAINDTIGDVFDIEILCQFEHYENGVIKSDETLSVFVKDGVPDQEYLDRCFVSEALGYVQISLATERPFFKKILTEHVYALIQRPDSGTFILNASHKFSDPLIIALMREVGKFCLVHPAQYVNEAKGAGNSTLIVNPFDGPIVARLMTSAGKQLRQKVPPKSAVTIPLQKLIPEGEFTCVQYTGNNRYPAWDVRHRYDAPDNIHRIDHLEFFRGIPTERRMSPVEYISAHLRSGLRNLGLRN